MADLLAGGSDSDEEVELKLNEDYAKNYNKWREKEELQKLKDKYGDGATLDSSSSSSESEDEDAEELTPDVEKKFLETLSALKSKDPKIYHKDTVFFEGVNDAAAAKGKGQGKKEKPMFLKDYERKVILEKEGVFSDDEEDVEESARNLKSSKHSGQYATAEEEEQLKRSFKAALADDDSDADDGDSLLKTAEKTKEKKAENDQEYVSWLKGEVDKLKQKKDAEKLGYLRSYWNSDSLEKSEEFLRDYILNKRYLEKNNRAPVRVEEEEDLSEDEATLEQQETFEHKFNYRFEEPDAEFIKKYPRTMQDSMRRKDDRRSVKRHETRERKQEEKELKKEEIKRLKALKRKEILDKLERLKEITGNDQVGFADEDIDGDFDPQEYDRRMNDIFNKDYYEQACEEQKPEDPVDEEVGLEDWDNWNGEQGEEEAGDEGGYDCDDNGEDYDEADPSTSDWTGDGERRGKRRRRSVFAKTIGKKKPLFDPSSKTFEEYFDEYYKLDFEDIVGGMPTRFRYRSVVPNDFGLSVDEILAAKDKELNRWCSVKKTCQHRPEHEEFQELQNYKKRASNLALKRKIFPSLFQPGELETTSSEAAAKDGADSSSSKRKRKRKKKSLPAVDDGNETAEQISSHSTARTSNISEQLNSGRSPEDKKTAVDTIPQAKKQKLLKSESFTEATPTMEKARTGPALTNGKKRNKVKKGGVSKQVRAQRQNDATSALKMSDIRLKAYGLNPKKVKARLIYGRKKGES
ncbi:protein KRI1 homolog [Ixodes scapularis]